MFTLSFRKASSIRTVILAAHSSLPAEYRAGAWQAGAQLSAVLMECLRLKKPFGFEFFANLPAGARANAWQARFERCSSARKHKYYKAAQACAQLKPAAHMLFASAQ